MVSSPESIKVTQYSVDDTLVITPLPNWGWFILELIPISFIFRFLDCWTFELNVVLK
jgi:hypothetical protein